MKYYSYPHIELLGLFGDAFLMFQLDSSKLRPLLEMLLINIIIFTNSLK